MKTPPDALSEALADAELVASLADTLPARAPTSALRDRLLRSVSSARLRWAPLFGKLGALFDLDEAALGDMAERASIASECTSS